MLTRYEKDIPLISHVNHFRCLTTLLKREVRLAGYACGFRVNEWGGVGHGTVLGSRAAHESTI